MRSAVLWQLLKREVIFTRLCEEIGGSDAAIEDGSDIYPFV